MIGRTAPAIALLAAALAAGCDVFGRAPSEYSEAQPPGAGRTTMPQVLTSEFQAGRHVSVAPLRNPYADAINEGERYYNAFNCAGCHGGRGGGGIGPPFLVPNFIYGSDAGSIYQSIVQGRPHGMPAFGGKAPDEVIWKITAYVQSLAEPYRAADGDMAGGRDREHGEGGG